MQMNQWPLIFNFTCDKESGHETYYIHMILKVGGGGGRGGMGSIRHALLPHTSG